MVALLAYLLGVQAARSGGLVVVERWFDRPVLLIGAGVVLIVVSVVVEFRFRTRWSQIGCAVALVALVAVGVPTALLAIAFSEGGRAVDRKADPSHPDHVLTVTDVAFSIDPVYRVEVLTGSGWSVRHWELGVWAERDGRGSFKSADWTGPNQITVTAGERTTVFTVDPLSGRPSDPTAVPR
ncbi:hypothetical protein [Kitasatospora sp. NPDC094015]|uniref:hypothetical protein n=1 Tax=Kitasatospora sp. NPDC094015 TaxID=3155205 RepID=UPI003320930B